MLKSFLINLRRKPKAVRDQVAVWFAGIFTFIIFVFWIFSLPGQFSSVSDESASGVISTIKEDIQVDVETPNFSEIREELPVQIKELTASSSEEEPVVIPNEFPTSTPVSERPIRLSTTTPSTTFNTQNSQ